MATKSREYRRGHWEERDSLTVAEARSILDAFPESKLAGMCKLNPGVPREQGMQIFRRCLDGKPDNEVLKSTIAKNIQREFGKP
jgi:hypothetical protein